MRAAIVVLHRWFGLGAALFLLITALTGALLPWLHELDALLNPQLFAVRERGPALSPLALAARIEAAHPDARVNYIPLVVEAGEALAFGVEPRGDPLTGVLPTLAFDEVFINPVTGAELGTRLWGQAWPLRSDNVMPFLYELHQSLHLPGKWGIWLLGGVALLWVLDCFAGFYLTLPARRRLQRSDDIEPGSLLPGKSWLSRWAAAWRVRWNGSATKVNFDLHRAGGLWIWPLLLILAFTSFSLSLYSELFQPALTQVATLTPSPYDLREPGQALRNREPVAGFAEILQQARAEGRQRGWQVPPGDIFYVRSYGFYRVKFFDASHPDGEGPLGESLLFYDGTDGALLGAIEPGAGSVGDLVVQAQYPLHSGRILGLAGRMLVSLLGIGVCVLVVTGIVIWSRKGRSRRQTLLRR